MTIAELIAELETPTGPALVLDGKVWCAVNGYEFVMWDGPGCVYRDPLASRSIIKHVPAREVRPFTASLDAAVALVEREHGPDETAHLLEEAILLAIDWAIATQKPLSHWLPIAICREFLRAKQSGRGGCTMTS